MTYSFYRKADGVIIAFDITSKPSFENIKVWMDSIDKNAPNGVPRILVGNKIDLEPQEADGCISSDEGQQLAKNYGINYHHVSAKGNINIDECMEDIF